METKKLPEPLFMLGYHPQKRKANVYHRQEYLDVINRVLETSEKEVIRKSQFGNLLENGAKIDYSMKFFHHMLSQQLVTKKKYELWVHFCRKPIRISMREFAITTGLNCYELKETDGKRKCKCKNIEEELPSFWEQLFGKKAKVNTSDVRDLLEAESLKDKEWQLRLALLLIVDGILLPTSRPNIIPNEHVRMVVNIPRFLSHPWGRESFHLTMSSIKGKKLEKYVQESVAIQGFAHGFQLVILHCIPQLVGDEKYMHGPNASILKKGKKGGATIGRKTLPSKKHPISIDVPYVRKIEKSCKTNVLSILPRGEADIDEDKLLVEDETDEKVDYMMELIEQGHDFSNESWVGGVRAQDVKIKLKSKVDLDEDIAEFITSCVESRVNEEITALKKKLTKIIHEEIHDENAKKAKREVVKKKIVVLPVHECDETTSDHTKKDDIDNESSDDDDIGASWHTTTANDTTIHQRSSDSDSNIEDIVGNNKRNIDGADETHLERGQRRLEGGQNILLLGWKDDEIGIMDVVCAVQNSEVLDHMGDDQENFRSKPHESHIQKTVASTSKLKLIQTQSFYKLEGMDQEPQVVTSQEQGLTTENEICLITENLVTSPQDLELVPQEDAWVNEKNVEAINDGVKASNSDISLIPMAREVASPEQENMVENGVQAANSVVKSLSKAKKTKTPNDTDAKIKSSHKSKTHKVSEGDTSKMRKDGENSEDDDIPIMHREPYLPYKKRNIGIGFTKFQTN